VTYVETPLQFVHPEWLLVGLLVCCGLLFSWRRYDARQRSALAQLVSPILQQQLTQSISAARRRAKRALFLASMALLFAALAEPQAGYRWEQVKRRGNDVIFAVDTSRSMSTPDIKPNRLDRAKLAISDFLTHLDGDAVGLVAFAGGAFLQCPITLDYGAFQESLNALDTHVIPRGGTNIESAIREAQAAVQRRPDSDRVMILVTDGEDLEGNALVAAKAAAKEDGLKIYTVGVGTANGDLIPLSAEQGGGFLKDASGNLVKSRLDESALKAIAEATGGLYAPLGAQGQGLESIYAQALAPLAKHDLASRQQKQYTERYQWPLAAALGLLLASMSIGSRRRSSRPLPRLVVPGASALIALLLLLPLRPAHASSGSAEQAYQKGDFVTAERDYAAAAERDPKKPVLQFNSGAAAYKAGKFPQAARAFQASISGAQSADTRRLAEQEDAYYDLGNTLYRTGQSTERTAPEQTIQSWTQALKAYDAALQLRADDADSKFNRDLVSRKLDALKKQQSQSQQQQSQQSQQQESKSQQQQSQSQSQSQSRQEASEGDSQQQKSQAQQSQPQSQQSPQQAQQSQPQQGSPQQAQQQPQSGQQQAQRQSGQTPNAGAAPPPSAQGSGGADSQRLPGQMSAEEARELLDSVKNDERHLPAVPLARSGTDETSQDQPLKDW
jgi:Ca-activated chloride channel homolog